MLKKKQQSITGNARLWLDAHCNWNDACVSIPQEKEGQLDG